MGIVEAKEVSKMSNEISVWKIAWGVCIGMFLNTLIWAFIIVALVMCGLIGGLSTLGR